MCHKLGHWVWIQGSGAVVTYDTDDKSALRLCGTHQDISLRKKSEEQVKKLSLAVEQSPNLVVITDIEGVIEYVNPKIYETTGYSANEVIGKHTRLFSSGETSQEDYKDLWATIKSGNDWRGTLHNKKKSGKFYWSQESISPIKDKNNNITHFVAIQEDITEAKKVSEQLSYQASHDPLTGLINRREFENRVNRTIKTSKDNDSVHVLCYLDLDQFKVINDTCTHIAGDELLKQIANILSGAFRHRDTVARIGGDEFAVLLEHCSIQQAERHAQELLTAVNKFQFHWDNKSFRVGISIGIVAITRTTKNTSSALSSADVACYSAKHKGRNCIHIFQSNDEKLALDNKELQWISRINQALNEDLFILYVQPICQLNNSEVVIDHYEVLVRLQDSNGDIIPPGAFLPAVERFNLSLQLDQWVIKSVFDWIKKATLKNIEVPFLSINLSGQNLGNQQLLAFIKKLLKSNFQQVKNKLCFEITETAAINNLTDAKVFIAELKEQGVKFALDDFGSGLSSFDYLRNLPVDFLKIDGQFLKNIVDDEVDHALVRSINEIGHVMGKKTIAEFVENKQILEILSDLKVDYVQGYHLGRPQPIDTLLIIK
ncbi:MAG: EAL domain-containing protein [Methyloprofundus sp.]|nr:EAL domain-containing protein [Methyloprofundus sp.]